MADSSHGDPLRYDPDFKGPIEHRSCTDILCLLLFLVFIACWLGIGIFAYTQGDPSVLLVPKDSRGARCGIDSPVIDMPNLLYFDLTKCLQPIPFVGCPTPRVCIEKCPEKMFVVDSLYQHGTVDDVICMPDVKRPTNKQEAMDLVKKGLCARWYLPSTAVLKRCLYNVADRKLLKLDVGRVKGDEVKLMQHRLDSSVTWLALVIQTTISIFTNNDQILQLRCIPNILKDFDLSELEKVDNNATFDNVEKAKKVIELLTKAEQVGNNVADDVVKSWWKILLGLICAVVVCIIYIYLIRWLAGIMVWVSIFGAVAALAFGVYFCGKKYKHFKENPVSEEAQEAASPLDKYMAMEETWMVLLIISAAVLIVIVLVLIFLRNRITLAIALIEEASSAVSSVKASLFFPVFPWILQIIVILYAISVGLYLSTVGDPLYMVKNLSKDTCECNGPATSYTNGVECDPTIFWNNCVNVKDRNPCTDASCSFNGTDAPSDIAYLHTINVFGYFWLSFFVSAMGEMILAGTFAAWYWTFRKDEVAFFAVTEAAIRTFRYHLGTLAFGSLIIAICRMIRVLLEYIDNKLKNYDNEVVKFIMWCCKCFFWCLENFLKFINRNAYIMCAVHGKNFCTSAKDAFNLLMRNIIRVFILDKVTDFILFLSKLLITALVTAIAYTIFVTDYVGLGDYVDLGDKTELNYNYAPVIIIAVGTFFIATVFFSVFEMAVDTLFLCFLEDSERNDGSRERPYYMSRNLMKILGKHNTND